MKELHFLGATIQPEKGSKIFKEFKEFAMRGNVVDLAVGVVIGAAFGKIVTAFVADFIGRTNVLRGTVTTVGADRISVAINENVKLTGIADPQMDTLQAGDQVVITTGRYVPQKGPDSSPLTFGRKYGISPGRVSQKRRAFHADWLRFHGEGADAPRPEEGR